MMNNGKKKVLILDDEFYITDLIERFLKRKNRVEIIISNCPMEALGILKTHDIDLLLTDIMMPKMNGVDVLKNVKVIKPDTHVMMMTAYSSLERMLECEKLGAVDYVTKGSVKITV